MRLQTQYVRRFASLVAVGLGVLTTAFGQSELPPGPGQKQVQKICAGCHSFSAFTQNRATKEEWGKIVDNMVSRGAQGTDEELDEVINYLATYFGPNTPCPKINVNKATPPELAKALALSPLDASAIVKYRTKHGNFKDLEQLESVPGIDRKRIEAKKHSIAF
jgi:competence ComEA-like helix-hairpin-helix protein